MDLPADLMPHLWTWFFAYNQHNLDPIVFKMAAVPVDPSTFIVACCGISLAWAAIQFSIISQTK